MKKRFLSALCALVIFFGAAVSSLAESGVSLVPMLTAAAEDYEFGCRLQDDGTLAILSLKSTSSDTINIPSEIDGKKVTCLDGNVFTFFTTIKEINIPESITDIGNGVFYLCRSLKKITVDSNNPAFTSKDGVLYDKNMTTLIYCPEAIESVTIPDSIKTIGNSAFKSCGITNSITIPDSVTTIEASAFSGSNFTSVTIGKNVDVIGDFAFSQCGQLTSIDIPDKVTKIGYAAFEHCGSLEDVSIGSGVKSIETQAFKGTQISYIEIPANVKTIGSAAFDNCEKMEYVFLSEGVESFSSAFSNCPVLREIHIPSTVTEMDEYAVGYIYNADKRDFDKNPDLTIYCTDGSAALEYAKNNKFNYCITDSNELTLYYDTETGTEKEEPETLKLFDYVVENEYTVTIVALKDNISKIDPMCLVVPAEIDGHKVTTAGNIAYMNWYSNLKKVIYSEGIKYIESRSCLDCKTLKEVELPDSLRSLPYDAFSGCYNLQYSEIDHQRYLDGWLVSAYAPSTVKTYHVREGTRGIASYAFNDMSIETVYVPGSVKGISRCAFSRCKKLKTINLSEGTEYLDGSIYFCDPVSTSSLETFNLPDSVIEVDEAPFPIRESLESNYTIADGAAYQKTWLMCDYTPYDEERKAIKVLPGTKYIANRTFCTTWNSYESDFIETVELPDSITYIGIRAFDGQTNLKQINLPDSITYIGVFAFSGTGLTDVTLPRNIKEIPQGLFESCLYLKNVNIPKTVTTIKERAFIRCDSLEEIDLPDDLERIEADAFNGCDSLKSVTIPDGVKNIGDSAFYNCESLKDITIPKSVTSIGDMAFGYYLKNIITKVDLTIYGYRNTAAEAYADEHGFTFIALDDVKKGDLNGNNKIDASDLLRVKSHIKHVKLLTGNDFDTADIDGDGTINAKDLLKMKAHMKGISLIW